MDVPVDYERVEPLPRGATVAAINSFVLNSTRFLNRFARVAESKIARCDADLSRLEVSLALLESKLQSIEGIAGGEYQAPPSGEPAAAAADTAAPPAAAAAAPAVAAAPAAVEEAEVAPVVAHDGPKVKDDERFKAFFKMLQLRIDKRNIIAQCQARGFDPAVLDLDPDSPAPPEGAYLASAARPAPPPAAPAAPSSDEEEAGEEGDGAAGSGGDEGGDVGHAGDVPDPMVGLAAALAARSVPAEDADSDGEWDD